MLPVSQNKLLLLYKDTIKSTSNWSYEIHISEYQDISLELIFSQPSEPQV